jgi:alpha-L-fucosidase 2
MELSYDEPATRWTDALPLGNGRLGAMCFGGARLDRIQINDDSCWSGNPSTAFGAARRKDGRGRGPIVLAELRSALDRDDLGLAESLSQELQSGYSQSYQPFIDLWIESSSESAEPLDYRRELDLRSGVAFHGWGIAKNRRRQWAFTSYVDQALVVHRTAEGENFDIQIGITSPLPELTVLSDATGMTATVHMPRLVLPPHANSEEPIVYAAAPGESVTAVARLEIRSDGEWSDGLLIGAHWVTAVLTSETDYAGVDTPLHGDISALTAKATMRAAATADARFETLRERHAAEHAEKMDRVTLRLDDGPGAAGSTDSRIRAATEAPDPGLAALAFTYGRYLLMACSRPGSRPAHLQGIWNEKAHPPWSSNYTININLEMNYWAAEAAGLPECSEPLLDFVNDLALRGRRTAEVLYGMPGWVAHHNSDIWGFSMPAGYGEGDPCWSMWPLAGAWLSRSLWERWEYAGDVEELRDRLWPVMRGAAEFLLAWLIQDESGILGTSPSTSPENHFIAADGSTRSVSTSTTADLAMIRDLFGNALKAMTILRVDDELLAELRQALDHLPVERIGEDGRIAEWSRPYADAEPHHRHQSQLYGVMPGESVLLGRDPELAEAAVRTLVARGGKSTGWSLAWRVALWARLGRSEEAALTLDNFLQPMPDDASDEPSMSNPSGVYRNLFCAHPPFQIDGNLAITAGIGELLLQSHGGIIRLLPSLPVGWQKGSLQGMRARGGLIVDLTWQDGLLESARLTATRPVSVPVWYRSDEIRLALQSGSSTVITREHFQR